MNSLSQARNIRGSWLVRQLAPNMLVTGLGFFWVTLVIWGEIGVFFWSLSDCKWPDRQLSKATSAHLPPTHVLLVADTQIAAPQVHSQTWRQFFRDIYTRKSWSVTRRLRPHNVIFLGDMLASGGKIESDDEYALYAHKFQDLFALDPKVSVNYIPGNADVGLGVSDAFTKHIRQRYEKYFGPVNQHLSLANHSLVLLDAPGIVDEDYLRVGAGHSFEEWTPLPGGTVEFVKGLQADEQGEPVVLFSHIPLHRAESRDCGPLRERGTINRGVGRGWQKTLGKSTSSFLLNGLRPAIVFSADDKDYCDITHALPPSDTFPARDIHEITIKSFSRVRHIKQPGLHLLSLLPASSVDTLPSLTRQAHAQCLFPSAYGPLSRLYVPFACLTVLILLLSHLRRIQRTAYLRLSTASPTPTPGSSYTNVARLGHGDDGPPSPYSASSAYAYSYAYSNTPSGQGQQGRTYFELPKDASARQGTLSGSMRGPGGLRTPGTPWTPWTHDGAPTRRSLEDEDDADHVGEQYLYVPPLPSGPRAQSDARDRRHLQRPPPSPAPPRPLDPAPKYEWTYAFTLQGRRRAVRVHAPRWMGTLWERVQVRSVKRGELGLWPGVARDVGRIAGPTVVVWAAFVWWFSG